MIPLPTSRGSRLLQHHLLVMKFLNRLSRLFAKLLRCSIAARCHSAATSAEDSLEGLISLGWSLGLRGSLYYH